MNMRRMQICVSLMVGFILLITGPGAASAQGTQPPAPQGQKVPQHETGREQAKHIPGSIQGPNGDGYYVTTGGAAGNKALALHPQGVQSSGGPDDYGYIWNETSPLNWIEASGGVDTGLSRGDSSNVAVSQAIDIGFSFPFYEHSYSQLYISTSGAVGFDQWSLSYISWTPYVPSSADPNNFIAPYLAPLRVNATSYPGKIYYLKGGTAPSRYMVIEWLNAKDDIGGTFTFEAVLRENGDIDFNYQSMVHSQDWVYCNTAAAIENADGSEGLPYVTPEYCNDMSGTTNQTVHFSHPAPSPRVWIPSTNAGDFSSPGGKARFKITLRNTGDLGTDTYNLSCSAACGFLDSDGQTPLTNTDSDPRIDTGPVDPMELKNIWVTQDMSGGAEVGSYSTSTLAVQSSLGTRPSRLVTLTGAVPAAFAQTFFNDEDDTMKTLLAQPGGHNVKPATTDNYWTYNPSIVEISGNRLFNIWYKGRCLDTNCQKYVDELYYSIQDSYGNIVSNPRKLADYSGETMSTEDYDPAVAVAPDGHIGLVYIHYRYDDSLSKANYNLYLTVLNTDGGISYGPVNLTNFTSFFSEGANGSLFPYNATIAATGDNRFVTAWTQETVRNSSWYEDIYTAVRATSGSVVQNPTRLLADSGSSAYTYPYLASLPNQQVLLAYTHSWNQNNTFYRAAYASILNSGGGKAAGPVAVSDSSSSYAYETRAAQLSDGKIMVGWISNDAYGENPAFRILDGSLNPVAGPASLVNPIAKTGNWYLSVTADGSGHGILTWADDFGGNNLYYALVNSAGSVLTPPMIGHSVPFGRYLYTSYGGYGVTKYSWVPPTVVDSRLVAPGIAPTQPGGTARIPVRIENRGGLTAHGITLTAVLGDGLTYAGATFGVSPTINGNQYTWNLPDLEFLEVRDHYIWASIPNNAPIGTLYPVSLTLTSSETDSNLADNSAALQVMSALQIYLPEITR